MKGKHLILATFASISLAGARPADALGPVYCTNCATEISELASLAKQADQYVQQVQSYALQLQQYANMVTNTTALPQELWANVQSDIMQVRNLSNAASLLSGNAGSIVTRLQSATGYAGQVTSLGNIAGQFTIWQQTIGNSVNTLGRTLGLQDNQEARDASLLAAMQQHSQSAQGQMQAIQAGNELAAQNIAQLQQIRATLTATAQMEATGMAVGADRRAHEDASFRAFTRGNGVSIKSGAGF